MEVIKIIRRKTLYIKCRLILFFLRLIGLKFVQAKSEGELEFVYKLRYDVYEGEGYIDPIKWKDGRLIDKYEQNSVSFLAISWGKPIGTARMIFDSSLGFPTEKLFPIAKMNNRKKIVEISRLGIIKNFRGSFNPIYRRAVMYGLGIIMYLYSVNNEIDRWLINMPEKLANSLRKFGIIPEKLKEGKLTSENISEREIIKGYFSKFTLYPYIIDINKI